MKRKSCEHFMSKLIKNFFKVFHVHATRYPLETKKKHTRNRECFLLHILQSDSLTFSHLFPSHPISPSPSMRVQSQSKCGRNRHTSLHDFPLIAMLCHVGERAYFINRNMGEPLSVQPAPPLPFQPIQWRTSK